MWHLRHYVHIMPYQIRIIFAGTPEFAVPALQSLITHGQQVIAVYTQPDRPAGRGLKFTPSPVKKLALTHGLPIQQPESLKSAESQATLAKLQADLMVVAAYGLLLPRAVLNIPRLGCVNIHASLLPRWRGAAPIQRAILAGDTETGITIMRMAAGLDTGPIIAQSHCPILPTDNALTVHDRLMRLGAEAIIAALPTIIAGTPQPQPQDPSRATYAAKLHKTESAINWQLPANVLARHIRAFNPWPIATTSYAGNTLRLWEGLEIPGHGAPGLVVKASAQGLDVGTGHNLLRITKLQLPNKKVTTAADFINAHDMREVVLE